MKAAISRQVRGDKLRCAAPLRDRNDLVYGRVQRTDRCKGLPTTQAICAWGCRCRTSVTAGM
jgi:hypothetical protein